MCCIDAFTNWPILIPCKDQSAYTTAKAIVQYVVCQWGIPDVINSDRGCNFTAELFRYMAKMLHMRQRISASKSARSNGLAESLVQRVSQMLKRFGTDDLDIELCLPIIELSLRASSLTRLPYSPFEIIHGRAMNIGEVPSDNSAIPFQGDIGNYVAMLRRELTRVHEDVRQRKIEIKRLDCEAYDKHNKVVAPKWTIGQHVLLENKTIKRDSNTVLTKQPWTGPYRISEVIEGEGFGRTYRLVDVKSGKIYKYLINSDRMKAFNDQRDKLSERLPGVKKQAPLATEPPGDHEEQQTETETHGEDQIEQSETLPDGFELAIRIVRQRIRRGKLQYLVLFADNSVWWCEQEGVTPQLLKVWKTKQKGTKTKKKKGKLKIKKQRM